MLITPSLHGTCVNKGNRLLLLLVHYNTQTTTVVIDVCLPLWHHQCSAVIYLPVLFMLALHCATLT